jgi:hypothetical protein
MTVLGAREFFPNSQLNGNQDFSLYFKGLENLSCPRNGKRKSIKIDKFHQKPLANDQFAGKGME